MNILLSLYCTWTGRIGFNFLGGAFGIILIRHQNQSGAKPEVFYCRSNRYAGAVWGRVGRSVKYEVDLH